MARRKAVRDNFWSHVEIGDPNECWPWTGTTTHGYGVLKAQDRTVTAHRFAYELTNGPLPSGLEVRHTCDNRPCCNPAHLLAGTRADNNQDRCERNRSACGERNGQAKLTRQQVEEIRQRRAAGELYKDIAQDYPVKMTAVRLAASGQTWRS